MPQYICEDCCTQTQQSYNFKTICKRSDDSLKLFLATGILKRGDEEITVSELFKYICFFYSYILSFIL